MLGFRHAAFGADQRILTVELAGTARVDRGDWYTLDLVRQPGVAPDDVSVTIDVPPGWRIAAGHGIKSTSGRHGATQPLNHTTRVRVRLAPATDNIWQRLVDGR
jgi:hypothetical protein